MSGTLEVSSFPDTNNGVSIATAASRDVISDGSSDTLMVGERCSQTSPQTTWAGAIDAAINPPTNPAYGDEGPATFCLTNTGTAAEGRVPNNALDHVEDTTSNHAQGVNFLLCDGSVRALQNSINPSTWAALGTRASGEVVGDW